MVTSNVTRITRSDGYVEARVSTPGGENVVIASNLLVAIPPTVDNLSFLDLTAEERSLFGQSNDSYYWDMVLKDANPDNVSLMNVGRAAPWNIPAMPALYNIGSTGIPGTQSAYYSSPNYLSDAEVKSNIIETLAELKQSLGYTAMGGTPEFVGFNSHAPFELQVPVEAMKDGFYGRLEGLQGKRNTYWTGASWQSQSSAAIWQSNEAVVLPRLLA